VSRKEARKPKIWRKQALDLLDLALAREKAASDAWVEEIAANYDLTAGIVRQGLPALHNSFFRLADTLYDGLNERQRAQAEAELKLGYAEMLEAVSPTAKARKRRAKRKAATTQKVMQQLAAVKAEFPGSKVTFQVEEVARRLKLDVRTVERHRREARKR
jgi:hypothetical protein